MKYLRVLLPLCAAGFGLATGVAQAIDEEGFLGQTKPPLEQTMGYGQSALWTLPDVATQYRPVQPTPEMQAALQMQQEGRYLDALIRLDEAVKNGQVNGDAEAEMNLLRSSFLLQGHQSQQALKILAPLLGDTRHATDAYVLTSMAHLQQGRMREALEAAQHARDSGGGMLPHLALSYAMQGAGRLAEALGVMHGFNSRAPQQAIALAREAELALTLDQIQAARALLRQAREMEAAQPYVIAVSGLAWLIDGQAGKAKTAFETALQRDPKDAKALFGLGLAEIKLGNFPAGLQKLQAANEADPGNALILTYLGRAQQQAGQTNAARASWRRAQQADPKDPTPWLYQAQAELQANRPLEARDSLREAQARSAYRQVYRGENLLREDTQLLQANLAEIQRRLGLEGLALHTLADPVGEKNAASLRNQADLLQGRRFGESARRSLLLQSLFNERPGNLPSALDIYGDMAGQTGASTPQHGAVSELNAQQASYNSYDELFGGRTLLEADAISGSKNTNGEQIRLGVGSDTLGLSLAGRQFKTDGFARFENLDNRVGQVIVQWRPLQSTQAFVLHQTFNSQHGEVFYPTMPWGLYDAIKDHSQMTRFGLHHSLAENSELRALWSTQRTDQTNDYETIAAPPFTFSNSGSSGAHGAELQYRRSGAGYATQWGVQQFHGQVIYPGSTDMTYSAQRFYATWQQALNSQWQLDAGLGWGKVDRQDNTGLGNNTKLARGLPRLGVIWTPDDATHVRLAAWKDLGTFAVGDATLAQTTLAGVVLNRYGDDGKLLQATSLGADRQLSRDWLLDGQVQQRNTKDPYIDLLVGPWQQYITQRVDESRLALQWQPEGKPWVVKLAYDYERIMNNTAAVLDSVNEQALHSQQLEMRWFASAQWTANLKWSHNRVTGTQYAFDPFFNPILLPYQDGFNQMDASLDWQFTKSGSLSAGVRNVADRRFQYTDIDRLNPRFSNGRLGYAKVKFAW